jgi:cytidylate kinase
MGIITISRTHGSGGTMFSRQLAARLGYECADRSSLTASCVINEDHVCAFGLDDEASQTFLDKIQGMMANRSFHKIVLMANIYNFALRNKVIFIGTGAGIILSEIPNVVSLRIVRPLSQRVKSLAEIKNINYDEAHRQVHEMDQGKREFISDYFDREIDDPMLYHLIINSGHVSLENAIELLNTYVGKYFTEDADLAARKVLKNKLLEKRAEILLFRLGMVHDYGKVTFAVEEEGVLTVKGVIGGEHQKKQLLETLGNLEEVKRIEDHAKVGVLSHIIY